MKIKCGNEIANLHTAGYTQDLVLHVANYGGHKKT
jgi:hypothetical protein